VIGPELLLSKYVDLVEVALKLLSRVFRSVRVGPFGFELRTEVEDEFGQTLEKIAKAQQNLAEAISAIDEVKTKYVDENQRLEEVVQQVRAKRAEYQQARLDLTTARALLAQDRETLRRSLGINDRRSKVVGFISGVLASLVAAVIWVAAPSLWKLLTLLFSR
jgi:hypothetical protein